MAKDRILIKPVGWEVFLVHDGKNILVAFAGSEAQAKRYAGQAEVKYGLKKKKRKNDRAKIKFARKTHFRPQKPAKSIT